ncbi:MAG: hypothetical protein V4573_18675 [Pseudomonadota bacterium]
MAKKFSKAPVPAPEREKRVEKGGSAEFGEDGTNKTLPIPDLDAEPSAELQGTKAKYIPETPYTRG